MSTAGRPRRPQRRLPRVVALLALMMLVAPSVSVAASDPLEPEQWAVAPGAILDLPAAWELSRGAGVTVAVIDSGIDLTHPDLAANLWTNTKEIAGNGRDDDGNGYVDDVNGIDLTTSGADNTPDDRNGHGTHVAGTIAAARDGRGVVGVAFKAKLMTIRVLDRNGLGTTEAVAAGVRYAASNGARIINMSLNGPAPSQALTAAVNAACSANVLLVVSAGNGGSNVDTTASYPVSIPSPCMVGVAGTSPAGGGRDLASNSNYGRYTIALAAPGVEVLSTALGGGYELRTGTSMATPHVAGVAALMLAVNPALTAPELRGRIMGAARAATLPVIAGYLEAADAVRAAASAVSQTLGQPPKLAAINVQVSGLTNHRWLQAQLTVAGSRALVRRYDVRARGRRIALIHTRRSTFVLRVHVRRAPRTISVVARDRAGRPVASLSAKVGVLREAKPYLGRKKPLATTSGLLWRATGMPASRPTHAAVAKRAPNPSATDSITIGGSQTVGALVADLIYYYRHATPGTARFNIVAGSSAIGIADAYRGVVSIGLAARDRRGSDPPGVVFTRMAGSAVCVATNARNELRNITGAQLREIVAGALTSWSQLPASGITGPLSIAAEPAFEGTQDAFDEAFLSPDVARAYRARYLPSAALVRQAIAHRRSAIGWLDLAHTAGLNVPSVDGIPCTLASVRSRRYPARHGLSFVTRGQPKGAAARFIRWVRTSGVARRVIAGRYVPVR